MSKIKPLPPVRVKINLWNKIKVLSLIGINFILWIILLVTGINLLTYYGYNILKNGFFDPETLKYSIILIVGAYFCLILDKNKIYDSLNIKF
ncbi:hypothetical protein HYW99_02955 [Candidatus Woesearchaeota archaeon]|nr:hypothetical protein [Candidatus Woesearchaeota archaeon]